MSEIIMVERVARAIARKNTGSGINWPSFVEEARAAIEAMREPTDAMVNAGQWQIDPVALYRGFIDAALSEVEG